ncbi:lipopolysaccharide biosynthesis protein [Leptobacterium sp. I13]|uniref:lipopolysaccharide biosynthesis protein n=1 Tax=Leptobacterium meishanense TaxID=3128904 RepID=UPI0030EC8CD1
MGIVVNQSFKNTITTYLGFAFGAINTLLLYPFFLTDEYYGLLGYLLSTSNILMPLMAFGVHNTLIKYYSSYTTPKEQQRFTTMMFVLPLLIIIPIGIIGTMAYENIVAFLSKENTIVTDYVWMIYVVAIAMAYFEVFFAWAKVHMRSVYGNFLKEVFHRVASMVLIFLIFLKWITVQEFILLSVFMYIARMLLMLFSAVRIKLPKFQNSLPINYKSVLGYSALIILAGSIAIVLLDIDKFMIGQYIAIENVAFYNVAVFIAVVITVPARAMHQITYPLTAKLINEHNSVALQDLYKRSSLNLYVIGGGIFLLIVLNSNELYNLLPAQYNDAVLVVFIISIAKLTDMLLGNNNSILFNSKYYKMILLFGLLLAGITIVFNMIFIPRWGINGAAIATLIGFLTYNTLKILYVYIKFNMHPFTRETLKTTAVIIGFVLLFFFWDFSFHPIVNITLKSGIIAIGYMMAIYRISLSKDIVAIINKYIKR